MLIHFMKILKQENELYDRQHRLARGSSIVTNVLTCDKIIADVISVGHHCDIFSFDFKAVFDKGPHRFVSKALISAMGIIGTSLLWFACYLIGRTLQMRVGNSLSAVAPVVFGVIQGFQLGPGLYTVLAAKTSQNIRI